MYNLPLASAVMLLGGFQQVTDKQRWGSIAKLFNPPKSCTAPAHTFKQYYQRHLFELEMATKKGKTALDLAPVDLPEYADRSLKSALMNILVAKKKPAVGEDSCITDACGCVAGCAERYPLAHRRAVALPKP